MKNEGVQECPMCGLINPASAQRCDCGHTFLRYDDLSGIKLNGDSLESSTDPLQEASSGIRLNPMVNPAKGCGIIVLIGVFLLLIISFFGPTEKEIYQAEHEARYGSKSMALIKANRYARQFLKAPSTAAFSADYESRVTDVGEGMYYVFSYVDSQNSYGAMIRKLFGCTVMFKDGEWFVEAFNFID